MSQVVNSVKCCATCRYWLGNRRPDRLRYVEIESPMQRGDCAKNINCIKKQIQANHSCSDYLKWSVLK